MIDLNPHILQCGSLDKTNCPPAGRTFERRRVKWHEAELVSWGEGHIWTEGVKIPATKGTLFFRRPGMVVQGVSPYHCHIIVFDTHYDKSRENCYSEPDHMGAPEPLAGTPGFAGIPAVFPGNHAVRGTSGFFGGLDIPSSMVTGNFSELSLLFTKAYQEWVSQREESRLFIKTCLLQIIMKAYEEYSTTGRWNASRSAKVNLPGILAAKEHIDRNLHRKFTLEELAAISGLSPNFFCKIFRDLLGETPFHYINRSKVTEAKKLLLGTNQSVKEIALSLGFENEPYFFTLFKSRTGCSPLVYKHTQSLVFQPAES